MSEKRTLTGKKIYTEREQPKPKFSHQPKNKLAITSKQEVCPSPKTEYQH